MNPTERVLKQYFSQINEKNLTNFFSRQENQNRNQETLKQFAPSYKRSISSGHIYNSKDRLTLLKYSSKKDIPPLFEQLQFQKQIETIHVEKRPRTGNLWILRKGTYRKANSLTAKQRFQSRSVKKIRNTNILKVPEYQKQFAARSKKIVNNEFNLERHPGLMKLIILKLQIN